jgi:cation diffusion facilitator CzcD-associated flavoprotein CzcO
MPDPQHLFDVVIIGAGQAGLAAAHGLVRAGLRAGSDFLVLDSNEGPGGAWRHRWDSLTLGRAHGIADLPGSELGEPDPEVPASQVVAEYYGRYEHDFSLAVVRPAHVNEVVSENAEERSGPLRIDVNLRGELTSVRTRCILNATGTWTRPFVPYIRGIDSFAGRHLHTVGYRRAEDFADRRTLVVGGGLSAVQFLLELGQVTETLWTTRRPPNFSPVDFNTQWGRDVEAAVRERTESGQNPASVVRTTGIPQRPEYLKAVEDGILISRGMIDEIRPSGVHFPGAAEAEAQAAALPGGAGGLGPSASSDLQVPESWQPFPQPRFEEVDVIFWNTGFRAALDHLAPLALREPGGGITVRNEVEVVVDSRVLLVGYGSSASTIGATRAGRRASRAALQRLGLS